MPLLEPGRRLVLLGRRQLGLLTCATALILPILVAGLRLHAAAPRDPLEPKVALPSLLIGATLRTKMLLPLEWWTANQESQRVWTVVHPAGELEYMGATGSWFPFATARIEPRVRARLDDTDRLYWVEPDQPVDVTRVNVSSDGVEVEFGPGASAQMIWFNWQGRGVTAPARVERKKPLVTFKLQSGLKRAAYLQAALDAISVVFSDRRLEEVAELSGRMGEARKAMRAAHRAADGLLALDGLVRSAAAMIASARRSPLLEALHATELADAHKALDEADALRAGLEARARSERSAEISARRLEAGTHIDRAVSLTEELTEAPSMTRATLEVQRRRLAEADAERGRAEERLQEVTGLGGAEDPELEARLGECRAAIEGTRTRLGLSERQIRLAEVDAERLILAANRAAAVEAFTRGFGKQGESAARGWLREALQALVANREEAVTLGSRSAERELTTLKRELGSIDAGR